MPMPASACRTMSDAAQGHQSNGAASVSKRAIAKPAGIR
jgi:hypothetical protein